MKKFVVLVVLMGLLLSACGAAPAAVSTGSDELPATLSTTGSVQIAVEPDVAYLTVGVHSEGDTVVDVVNENNATVDAVMAALRELGVEDKDLKTSNYSIYLTDKWSPIGESIGKVYMVDNTVYVTVRALDDLGKLLAAAVDAGANNIWGIQFDVADKSAALSEGRAKAIAKAQAQAEELATAAGITLGDIVSINYYGSNYTQPYYGGGYGGGGGGGASEAQISAGQLTVTVEVTVVYSIGK